MKIDNDYIEDERICLLLKLLANSRIGRIALNIALKKIHHPFKGELETFIIICKCHS